MGTAAAIPVSEISGQLPAPPLRNGDRLTAVEFERRYNAMAGLKKAELIEGVVYMPSPVSFEDHAGPHFDFITWLGTYRVATKGIRGGDNATLRLDLDSTPQPDGFLVILPAYGGRVRISTDGYIEGGPELTAEIAASSVSYDLHDKLRVFRRNAVLEYVVWRVLDSAIDWFVLREGRYDRLSLAADGLYKSFVLPGLWLDPKAMISGDMETVMKVLNQGISSAEHAEFVEKLKKAFKP